MNAKPALIRLGNLDAIEFPSSDPKALTCVVMHGYGADMRDLAPLASEIPAERPIRWIFPDAPETLDWGGRAWFPIDVAAFEEAQRTGKPRDLSLKEPDGMADARAEMLAALKELGAAPESLVLAGFSQGAMMAVDLASRMEKGPAGVTILSGTLVDAKNLAARAAKKKGLRFFQSHGSVDPILGFPQALALEKTLTAAGWSGRLQRFEGAHGIPPEVVEPLGKWLDAL